MISVFHQPQSLPITAKTSSSIQCKYTSLSKKKYSLVLPMRSRHGKVTHDVLLRVPSLLMPDEHVAPAIYASHAGYNGWIIVACTISMEFHPLLFFKKTHLYIHHFHKIQFDYARKRSKNNRYLFCDVQDMIEHGRPVGVSSNA